MAAPVSKGEELELRIDSPRLRRERRRAPGRLRRLRPARPARRPRPRARHEGEAQPRRGGGRSRCVEPGAPRVEAPCAALPGLRRLPLPGSRLRGAARGEGRPGRATRSSGSAASRELAARADPSRPSRSSTTATSSSTRSRPRRTAPALGFHRAGRWDEVLDIETCWLTTDLGNAIRDAVRDVGARGGARSRTTRRRSAGYLRHLVVREGRNTGQALVAARHRAGRAGVDATGSSTALRRFPRGALDPLGGERPPGRGDEPADRAALGRGRDRGGAPRPALPRAPERVPPDEHGDGRAAVRARRSSTPH